MPKIKSHKLSKLSEFLKRLEAYQAANDSVWFRGIGDTTYPLLPSIARLPGKTADEIIEKIEPGIAATFSQRSLPFVDRDLSDPWRSLFFMQHYGVPTRLLDWTESPFIALYFALASVKRNAAGAPLADAAVWLCNPILWNRYALSHISFGGGVLDESCEEIKAYAPGEKLTQLATIPVMIYGAHNSPRIVAQRGVFALFGKCLQSMQDLYEKEKFKRGTLEQIVVEKANVDTLLASLFGAGIAESVVFPDLFGLSLEIRRKFGYPNG